jgi:methionyl-tRNA formyltransferase
VLNHFGSTVIDLVVIGQDKNIDHDHAEEILAVCNEHKIAHVFRHEAYTVKTKYAIAVSWRWMIDAKTYQLIVLHDSLLPKYRGFAPLVSQLINKENTLGVTALFATADYDQGDIIGQRRIEASYPYKIKDAIAHISSLYEELILDLVAKISNQKEIVAYPQNHAEATYSLWRDEQDYHISWDRSAAYIERFVNAVGKPYKGAFSRMNGLPIRIYEVEEQADLNVENRTAGKVLFMHNSRPVVVCGTGLIRIKEALFEDNGQSIFPLKKLRIRFT